MSLELTKQMTGRLIKQKKLTPKLLKRKSLDPERIGILKNEIVTEYERQAFEIKPVGRFTWKNKQAALDALASYTGVKNQEPQVQNNFILVRND